MIYDCFVFFEEVEALEIRFNELADVVDRFVLVEATHTFRGEPRQSVFRTPYRVFDQWRDRTTHIVVDELLPKDPWRAEAYVRDQIMRGLTQAEPEDIVVISDVDEIPNHVTLKDLSLRQYLSPTRLAPRNYYYCLDWEVPQQSVYFPVVVPYREFIDGYLTPTKARQSVSWNALENTAWHFSCLGGAERLSRKLRSFAHAEVDTPEINDRERLARYIREGRDILDRWMLTPVDVDSTYPLWVQENIGNLGHLLRENQ